MVSPPSLPLHGSEPQEFFRFGSSNVEGLGWFPFASDGKVTQSPSLEGDPRMDPNVKLSANVTGHPVDRLHAFATVALQWQVLILR